MVPYTVGAVGAASLVSEFVRGVRRRSRAYESSTQVKQAYTISIYIYISHQCVALCKALCDVRNEGFSASRSIASFFVVCESRSHPAAQASRARGSRKFSRALSEDERRPCF